jgi:hypothetical protein
VLKGPYAFLLRGADSGGTAIAAGSFTADGNGKITGGSLDQNRVSSGPQSALPIQPSVSTYSVGSDRRGCLTLTTANGNGWSRTMEVKRVGRGTGASSW